MGINKRKDLHFRCTGLEKEIIKKKAENCGLSMSEYLRSCALQKKVSYRLTQEEIQAFQTLTLFARNFQSIANLFRSRDPRLSEEVLELVSEIKEQLNKFK